MRFVATGIIAFLALVILLDGAFQAGEKAKYTISDVMLKVHKKGLHTKVAKGQATEEEKKQLVEMYTALTQLKPPMGDLDAWKKQTGMMLEAAKGALKGDAKAAKSLATIVNCKACHKDYK